MPVRKTLKQRLHEVDPHLTIVTGGMWRHHRATDQEWLAATGVMCKECGKEVQKSRDGLCMSCWEKREDSKVEIRDKAGILNWMPDILSQITHSSGKK